jgi:glycosyltransferase involved in cell wall biosynthesis
MAAPRVAFFLPSLGGGGAERALSTVASGLAARGVPLDLVLARAEGPYLQQLHPSVQVVDLGSPSTLRALLRLTAYLRTTRPTALLAAMTHANLVAAWAHRLAGSPGRLVLSERVHLSGFFADNRGPTQRITQWLVRHTYPGADRVVAVSEGVADDLHRHARLRPEQVCTIVNPVVTGHLLAQAAAPPSHRWLQGGPVPVVLAAGRLVPQKDHATLLEAFARVRRSRPLRLVVLGEGELRPELRAQAERLGVAEDVDFPGFESNPFAHMRAASVFVLSSRFEGLPGVLIQAMACGCRVVSTDCPSGPREVLDGGRWGPLVPVGDAASLASAIEAALDDPAPPDVRAGAARYTEAAAVEAFARVLGVA